MSGDVSYDAKDDSFSWHDSTDVYLEQEENCENISCCSNSHEPIEVSKLNNIDHLIVHFNPQSVCNQGYETMLQHIVALYDQHDKGYDADASCCNDKINVHEDMSMKDLMHASDWGNVYNTKGKAKENENEGEGSLSSEQISELLTADLQKYASKNVPNLSYPINICFDTDDVLEGVKYDTYDIFFFLTFELNSRQDENVYKINRCNDVDSNVDMNSEFKSYVDLGVKEKDKSKVVFLDLQVVNEPLLDDIFPCLQSVDRNCDQQDQMQHL